MKRLVPNSLLPCKRLDTNQVQYTTAMYMYSACKCYWFFKTHNALLSHVPVYMYIH